MRSLATFSVAIFLAVPFAFVSNASLVNITIDDTTGDAQTGDLPTYTQLPGGAPWMSDVDCKMNITGMCPWSIVDTSSEFNSSWHASWGPANMSLTFNGTAIYTYFIIPGYVWHTGYVGTNLSFLLDEEPVGTFTYVPRVGDDAQSVLAYGSSTLSNTVHELTMQASPQVVRSFRDRDF
ncbi:hypothetical protein DFH11DRAFT_1502140 [Phellopilus nigrolimitatus]|nr:hypothetical protein DFH11DRAFT_1502140 [Phellopilus nigrolimitatus]